MGLHCIFLFMMCSIILLYVNVMCREKTTGCCDSIMLVCESVDVSDDCCFSGSNCQV